MAFIAALERAREAAGGLDVRIPVAGPATVRQYLQAGLVDEFTYCRFAGDFGQWRESARGIGSFEAGIQNASSMWIRSPPAMVLACRA